MTTCWQRCSHGNPPLYSVLEMTIDADSNASYSNAAYSKWTTMVNTDIKHATQEGYVVKSFSHDTVATGAMDGTESSHAGIKHKLPKAKWCMYDAVVWRGREHCKVEWWYWLWTLLFTHRHIRRPCCTWWDLLNVKTWMMEGKIVMEKDAEAVYSSVAITHRLHVVSDDFFGSFLDKCMDCEGKVDNIGWWGPVYSSWVIALGIMIVDYSWWQVASMAFVRRGTSQKLFLVDDCEGWISAQGIYKSTLYQHAIYSMCGYY